MGGRRQKGRRERRRRDEVKKGGKEQICLEEKFLYRPTQLSRI